MKYLIIVAVLLIGGAFYWMNQSNKQDAEALKQQQIAYQQKLEQEKAEELNKQYGGTVVKEETVKNIVEVKMSQQQDITPEQAVALNKMIVEWSDASTVATSTARIALSQPVSRLQEIKRNLSEQKYQGCAESTRLLYLDAMNTSINSYLAFMKGKEYELEAMSLTVDYVAQLKQAESEKQSCKPLSI